MSKIIPALQSRCTRFRFAPLPQAQIKLRIKVVIEKEKVNISEGGVDALLKLSQGDMRKALNILQAASAAYDTVDADSIHTTTGAPLPEDIQSVVEWLLNEPYTTAFSRIQNLKTTKGLALMDLLQEIHEYLMQVTLSPGSSRTKAKMFFVVQLEMPSEHRIFLMDRLATIESNLSTGASEKMQLGFLVGSFREAVASITALPQQSAAAAAAGAAAGADDVMDI